PKPINVRVTTMDAELSYAVQAKFGDYNKEL
nr:ezrin homolog - bovine (fragments) [Bos taurus]